jgi:hypothetical protein
MHPNPNTILNRVHAGWTAFHTLMSFFGFFRGFINLLVWLVFEGWDARLLVGYVLHRKGRETSWWPGPLHPIFGTRDPTYESALPTKRARNKPKKYGTLRKVFICFVLIPAAIIMVLGPFFGPMIALPWAELVRDASHHSAIFAHLSFHFRWHGITDVIGILSKLSFMPVRTETPALYPMWHTFWQANRPHTRLT